MFPLRYGHRENKIYVRTIQKTALTFFIEYGKPEHLRQGQKPSAKSSKVDQASRPISIARLNALPHLHLRPINLVIFQGPSGRLPCGIPDLGAGFALRCFQRLSHPNIATEQSSWRKSSYTSGSFILILSYKGRLPSSINACSR